MQQFPPVSALLGGAMLGLSAGLLLYTHGRVAGIGGMFGDLLRPDAGRPVRAYFLAGLVIAGVLMAGQWPSHFAGAGVRLPVVAAGGLLVGFGMRRGAGCTSGHGICGISRMSTRSIVATCTFLATGALTVYLTRHLLGGAS